MNLSHEHRRSVRQIGQVQRHIAQDLGIGIEYEHPIGCAVKSQQPIESGTVLDIGRGSMHVQARLAAREGREHRAGRIRRMVVPDMHRPHALGRETLAQRDQQIEQIEIGVVAGDRNVHLYVVS